MVCISLIGGASASLLNELLLHPSSVRAWMLLSRLCSRSQPIVLLLPVDSVLEGMLLNAGGSSFPKKQQMCFISCMDKL